MEIGISLGSNMGRRVAHFHAAHERLEHTDGIRIIATSPIYETEPVDVADDYAHLPFLNAVIIVESESAIETIAAQLREIEDAFGRVRGSDKNAPRPLDLDVLYADHLALDTEKLRLPHPRWNERRFVVQPLADVRPDLVLPGERRTVSEILAALPERPTAVLHGEQWTPNGSRAPRKRRLRNR